MCSVHNHTLVLSFGALSCALTALYGWHRRAAAGGWAFAGMMAASTIWTGAAAVESTVTDVAEKILWSKLEYVGLVFLTPLLLRFVLAYTQHDRLLPSAFRPVLWGVPLVSLALVWTNEWHHWVWAGFSWGPREENVLVYHRGPAFWLICAFIYLFAAIAYGVLAYACRRGERAFRRQYMAFMLSGLFPLGTGLVYLSAQDWVLGMDVSPLGFSVAGLLIAWNLFHYRLLDLVPIGRAMLLDRMPDGMVVLDAKGRLVDINAVARRMLELEAGTSGAAELIARWPAVADLLSATEEVQAELGLKSGRLDLDVRMVPLFGKGGRLQGRLLILHDVTARLADARERERNIDELRQALAQIKTLQSLLPICCSCKKIRNDEGYWEQIESYISEHAGVAFSHGICPECARALYGEDDTEKSSELTP